MYRRPKALLGLVMILVGGLWAFAVMIWLPPVTLAILTYRPTYYFKINPALVEALLAVAMIIAGIWLCRRSKPGIHNASGA